MTEPRPANDLHEVTADARDRLRGMALSLATGNALVEPSAFDEALSRLQGAVLRDAADRLDRLGTLDAARQSGRRAIGIEADERYCEAAARRLSALTLPAT